MSPILASGTQSTLTELLTVFPEKTIRRCSNRTALDATMEESRYCCRFSSASVGTSSLSSIAVVMVSSLVPYLSDYSLVDSQSESKIWTVKQISKLNAKDHKFDVTEKATGKVTNMSVFDYFKKKYNVTLIKPWLPLVQTQKPNVLFPMEVCVMCDGQRYPYKLNSDQVRLARIQAT